MRVYVETNFIAEIALAQTQAAAASALLAMAEKQRVELALPVFALYESFRPLRKHDLTRKQLMGDFGRLIRQMQEFIPSYPDLRALDRSLGRVIAEKARAENEARDDVIGRLKCTARRIPFTEEHVEAAGRLQSECLLGAEDAVILQAILTDLADSPTEGDAVFATLDHDYDRCRQLLKQNRCLLLSYADAERRIGADGRIGPQP